LYTAAICGCKKIVEMLLKMPELDLFWMESDGTTAAEATSNEDIRDMINAEIKYRKFGPEWEVEPYFLDDPQLQDEKVSLLRDLEILV